MLSPSVEDKAYDPVHATEFVAIDTALRRGAHISEADADLHAFLLSNEDALRHWYRRFNLSLEKNNENVFYLHRIRLDKGRTQEIRRLSALSTYLGLLLCRCYFEGAELSSGVIDEDDLFAQVIEQVPAARMAKLFGRRGVQGTTDRRKMREEFDKALVELASIRMIVRFKENKSLRPLMALSRFLDPIRTLQEDDPQAYHAQLKSLLETGYLWVEQQKEKETPEQSSETEIPDSEGNETQLDWVADTDSPNLTSNFHRSQKE